MNYTLNQLQVFLKVVQTQSVTKASEELFLTQPAVSIQLRNFQDQFDIPLTELVGRKLYVTDFGKEIAAAAESILSQVNDINMRTMAYKGLLTGRLRISTVSTGKYVMPYFLSGFLKQHPGIELNMDVTNKSRVLESFENNENDFSLVSILPEKTPLRQIELIENTLYLVGNRESKIRRNIKPGELFSELPLIFREKGSGTRQTMERFLLRKHLPVNRKMELTSNEAVKQAIIAGLGFSIMPVIGIKNELQNGSLKIIPVKGLPIKTSWRLIWPKGKKLSPVADAYLRYLEKEKQQIIKTSFSEII